MRIIISRKYFNTFTVKCQYLLNCIINARKIYAKEVFRIGRVKLGLQYNDYKILAFDCSYRPRRQLGMIPRRSRSVVVSTSSINSRVGTLAAP